MKIPEAYVYFPSTDTRAFFAVRDLWIDFDGALDSIQIKPFERTDQALQRVYPGCEIYMKWAGCEPQLINPPGMREWLA